jgi:hypothetical protein
MYSDGLKSFLFSKLMEENHFGSHDVSQMDAVSDNQLIENVLPGCRASSIKPDDECEQEIADYYWISFKFRKYEKYQR